MRRFILKKYSRMLNKEHKGLLGFCSFILVFILCFFSQVFLPVIKLSKLVVKSETCKFDKIFSVVNSKRNNFVTNTSLKKQYSFIGFVT
ncbi:MAG: hypothetical protein ACUZ8H_11630 [Candidatus Anammoxibacter sp.]